MILLNRQRVLVEVMELTRYRVAQRLKIGPDKVQARWVPSGDSKMLPELSVPESEELGEEGTKRVLAEAYESVRAELFSRLGGLRERRQA